MCRGNQFITPENDEDYKPKTYYYTDAISDNAVTFLQEHAKVTPDKPVFLYVSYTTAHWPMHALPEDIARYKGVYDGGFQEVRPALCTIEGNGIDSQGFEALTSRRLGKGTHKEWDIRNMEVYAAMVDNMDRGIGRIVAEFKQQGTLDNTLIMYLQDNGACAEGFGRYSQKPYRTDYKPLGRDGFQTKIWPPMQTRDGRPVKNGGRNGWPGGHLHRVGRGWANVSNTPFREYKHFNEERLSSPLIVSWPKGIDSKNSRIERQPGHLIDLMSTCLDAASVNHHQFGEYKIQPVEGMSLLPAFRGGKLVRKDALYFDHHLNGAVRMENGSSSATATPAATPNCIRGSCTIWRSIAATKRPRQETSRQGQGPRREMGKVGRARP